MEDSVLRCLVEVRLDGITMPQIFDAVPDGEFFRIVLEWGELEGAGRAPRQYVRLPNLEFETVDSVTGAYELICRTGIDLDSATTTDLTDIPTYFFQKPPI